MLHHVITTCRYNLRVRLYRPRSASLLQTFTSWLTGMPAEFSDPKFPSYGEGREGERVTQQGVSQQPGVWQPLLQRCWLQHVLLAFKHHAAASAEAVTAAGALPACTLD